MTEEKVVKKKTYKTPKTDCLQVKVKVVDPRAKMPVYQTKEAAAFDLATIEDVLLANTNAYEKLPLVRTGLAFDIPEGYHMEIYVRSSTGLKTKVRLANQVGIIDSDYKDEVYLVLENIGRHPVTIKADTRIAQAIIKKNEKVVLVETKEIGESTHGGFGSTGGKA